MGDPYTAYDRYLWSVDITTSDNQIVITESGGSAVAVTISADTYWAHNDDDTDSTYPGLFKALEDALNASGSLSGTYTLESQTPTGSSLEGSGLRINSTVDFTLNFTDTSTDTSGWTLDPRLLGWPEGQESDSDVSSSSTIADSPLSYYTSWVVPDAANDLRPSPISAQASSSPDASRAFTLRWDANTMVNAHYMHLEGAHIFSSRATEAGEASFAGLPADDEHNALRDLWERCRDLTGPSDTTSDILAVFVEDGATVSQRLQVQRISGGSDQNQWAVLRLGDAEQRSSFRAMIQDLDGSGGEVYQVRPAFQIEESHWNHFSK